MRHRSNLLCITALIPIPFLILGCGDGPTEVEDGSLEVSTVTTGSAIDSDGYTVTVDGSQDQSLGVNTSAMFTRLVAGEHDVELTGIASDCAVQGFNPRTVTVTAGDTTSTTFTVACSLPTTSAIAVTISTTGAIIDLDGYTATVAGTEVQAVRINDSRVFADLVAGDHNVELTGLARDCAVQDPNPRSVTVAADDTVSTAFTVACNLDPRDRIAFTSRGTRNLEISVMNADGSRGNLTADPASDFEPAWSPDGSRIAFTSGRDGNFDIYVMNADGSNPVNLTNHPATEMNPEWSPDGMKIAYRSDRDGDDEIYVINVDGSNETRLTNNPAVDLSPAWSPDGLRIAFTTTRDVNAEIYVMDADGSNPVNLTNNPAMDLGAAWSPDGSKIAFGTYRLDNFDIYVMDANGMNPVRVTGDPDWDDDPSWSPDGARIVFSTYRAPNFSTADVDIYVMDADGSNRVGLTQDASSYAADWSP